MAKSEEKKLEHTREGSTTRDALDQGAPMAPGEGPQGPEDALEKGTRGDYAGRVGEGRSHTSKITGYREDGSPIIEMVRQK